MRCYVCFVFAFYVEWRTILPQVRAKRARVREERRRERERLGPSQEEAAPLLLSTRSSSSDTSGKAPPEPSRHSQQDRGGMESFKRKRRTEPTEEEMEAELAFMAGAGPEVTSTC